MSKPLIPRRGWERIPLTETENEVLKLIKDRHILGRQKYGVGISFKQGSDPVQWVVEALDEVADLIQYLTALKLLMQDMKTKGAFNGYDPEVVGGSEEETLGCRIGQWIDSSIGNVSSVLHSWRLHYAHLRRKKDR